MGVRCDKCKRGWMRQQLSVFVDAPLDCRSLSKQSIRSKHIRILGAGWDRATIYCDAGCGNVLILGKK